MHVRTGFAETNQQCSWSATTRTLRGHHIISPMVQEFQKSWGDVLASVDKAVGTLTQISLSSEGREFLNNLERGEAGLCAELLDRVRSYLPSSLTFATLKPYHRDWRDTRLTRPRGNRSLSCSSSWSSVAEDYPTPL